jgi:hypothetical protein
MQLITDLLRRGAKIEEEKKEKKERERKKRKDGSLAVFRKDA